MTPAAIIADDEPLLRTELREALAVLWPDLAIAAEVGDGDAALRAIDELEPAVSFLDIRMPKLSGLEVAERVQGATQVVFVTAYDEHAVAAFEQGAVDYLLKPVKRARLAATVERLKTRLAAASTGRDAARPWLQRIQATVGNTLRFVPVREVAYFCSDGKYTRVIASGSEALIRRSLSALLQDLDPEVFWQINRGIVVNIEHIDSVVRDEEKGMVVRLRNGAGELTVSKSHHGLFRGM
ncbi:MAG TPA: LytTR family DNA-binding domain-containing protein [Gammaproteobacteria bacterium]|nr:LytTR family DNA-binding domain-containing protein [Gammaproteobacteria bacterium]